MKVLVNNCSRRLGIPGRPAIILAAKESVSINDNQVEAMKQNRTVSRWLERGVLSIRDHDGKEDEHVKVIPNKRAGVRGRRDDREKLVLPEGVTGEGVETHEKGGGWYDLYVNGFKATTKSVRKDEVNAMAAEYE